MLIPMIVLMPAWYVEAVMSSRIRYVFTTMYEFYIKKNMFFESLTKKKGCFIVIMKYNLFSYVYIIPVSLSRPGIFIYMVSIFS